MKLRKLLPLALLVLGAVFLLSSCDQLLDAIFSNNTINVYVTARIVVYGYYPQYDSVGVTVSGPANATAGAAYGGNDGYYMYWSVSIPKLSEGSYTVTVTYSHPVGVATGTYFLTDTTTFPQSSGTAHSVDLGFNF